MKHTNRLLFSVAASIAMITGPAMAQQVSSQLSSIVTFATTEAVQKELGVSDDVARKLTQLDVEYSAMFQKEYDDAGINPRDFPNRMTDEQRRKYIEIGRRLNDECVPKAMELLSADQQRRLQQIAFQSRLMSNYARTLAMSDVASELNLTDDQRQQLTILGREFIQSMFGPGTNGKGKEGIERMTKQREEYTTKANEVLTAEQKEKLNKLKGKDFDPSLLVVRRSQGKAK